MTSQRQEWTRFWLPSLTLSDLRILLHNSPSDDRAKMQLDARFRAYFPEMRGGSVRRVVAWLGWRVVEGGASAPPRD